MMSRMSKARSPIAVALAVAVFAAAGCGGDDSEDTTQGTVATQTETQVPTTPSQSQGSPAVKKVRPAAGEAELSSKPEPPKGKGDPPTTLVAQDLIVGKGKAAKAGDTVSVQYVGVLFDNGKEFDASWNGDHPGKAFQFPLGGGQVIPGWDQGVVGMRVGGRRKLIIPADLAYGAQGYPPDIPANAALIFDIDLKKIG
jgi:peptidylprolyl isomerase